MLEKPPQPTPRDTKGKYGKFQPLVTRHNIWVITDFLFITMGQCLVDTAQMSGKERTQCSCFKGDTSKTHLTLKVFNSYLFSCCINRLFCFQAADFKKNSLFHKKTKVFFLIHLCVSRESLGRSKYDPWDLVSPFLNESCLKSFTGLRGGLGRESIRLTKEVQNVLFTYLTSWKT